ncbi:hypothetical protein K9M16_05110 [Candidatus Babeliales bacterium]|nr:hypothetical protein [Candidatus Babeliales bacterium]MCF7910750.1 hypothetical protein [Candidatus Pacearchaeota archaeon]
MPHQCVHCSRFIPVGSRELLEGCKNCGSKFFFYIKDEHIEGIKNNPVEIPQGDKKNIEKDIRDMAGIKDEEAPVVLDIEAVRAIGQGKYEIDVAKLFKKNSPLIYKLEEGKYIIDLSSTLSKDFKENIEKE